LQPPAGLPFELIPNAQILPRALNQEINGTSEYDYLTAKDGSSRCVLGIPFLERFYTCFNSTSQLIGFANTSFTMSEIN
jgi:cathepsin E